MTNTDDFIDWLYYKDFSDFKEMVNYMKKNGGLTEDNRFPSITIRDAAIDWFETNKDQLIREEHWKGKTTEVTRDRLGRFIKWFRV